MPKYECRTCESPFVQAATANRLCPACGSNNIYEVWDEPKQQDSLHDNLGIIISCVVVVVMLVVLFVLPYVPHKYLASVQAAPENCGFSISVTEYGYPVDTTSFQYSVDNEKYWKESPRVTAKVAGSYEVKVKETDNEKDTIYYAFINPYTYQPASSCMPVPPDTCDCKNLKVIDVRKEDIGKRKAIVVVASLPNCGILYSISGINGKYQSENIFYSFKPNDSVFIKRDSCDPVGYYKNPFIASAKPITPPLLHRLNFFNEIDVHPKPHPPISEQRSQLISHLEEQIQGFIPYNSFTISLDVEPGGEITNITITPSISQSIKNIVINALNNLGNWSPGYKNGNPVLTHVVIPIPSKN